MLGVHLAGTAKKMRWTLASLAILALAAPASAWTATAEEAARLLDQKPLYQQHAETGEGWREVAPKALVALRFKPADELGPDTIRFTLEARFRGSAVVQITPGQHPGAPAEMVVRWMGNGGASPAYRGAGPRSPGSHNYWIARDDYDGLARQVDRELATVRDIYPGEICFDSDSWFLERVKAGHLSWMWEDGCEPGPLNRVRKLMAQAMRDLNGPNVF
jgi:hypothetical protein